MLLLFRLFNKPTIIIAGLAVLLVGAVLFHRLAPANSAVGDQDYVSELVERGDISRSVATSGAVRPLVTVQVGSQLSGQVDALFVDFNDEVTSGQVVARIDPQTFLSRVEAAKAEKTVADSNLQARHADLRRATALADRAQSDLARYASLGEEAGVAEIEMDALRAALQAAKADVDSAKAQIANAQAQVAQRAAALAQAEVDLDRTEIRSPINGVVIQRSVDVGQTVAASLSAPVLFEIAQDLSQIQIEADVNEADIGTIRAKNPVRFTVDAYPDRVLEGYVDSVRLAPVETANVVTYTVIIHAENPGRILYPGMTATVEIITGQRSDTLRVPNLALRFSPSNAEALLRAQRGAGPPRGGGPGGGRLAALQEQLALSDDQVATLRQQMQAMFARAGNGPGASMGPPPSPQDRRKRFESMLRKVLTPEQFEQYRAGQQDAPKAGRVWVLTEQGQLEPRRVFLGVADGSYTEVVRGQLDDGERVVLRQNSG